MVERKTEKGGSMISVDDIPPITRQHKTPKIMEDLQNITEGQALKINPKEDYNLTISGIRYFIKKLNKERTEQLEYTLRKEGNIRFMYVYFEGD